MILPERKSTHQMEQEGERRGKKLPKPPKARVGRIVLKDMRIFTKDTWIRISINKNGHSAFGNGMFGAGGTSSVSSLHTHDTATTATSTTTTTNNNDSTNNNNSNNNSQP